MANLAPIRNKLTSLRRQKDVASNDTNYLFDTMPTLQEWKQATDVRVGSRGTTSNPELLQIDAQLVQYNLPARGSRAKAIKEIKAIIGRWKARRGPQANTSERHDAMEIVEEIVDTLCVKVVYDRDKWLALQQYAPTGPDKVRGGYGEEGATVERARQGMIKEMSGPGSTAAENDSMNEAGSRILDAFGLRPGSQYSGGATCFSAASWAASNIRGSVTRYNNKKYDIAMPVSIERNRGDTHRYAIDAKGILIDTTWRQFFRQILGKGTPGIFVGTPEELAGIVMDVGANPDKIAGYIYTGTRAEKTYRKG
jgi:hypothetical protein